jgi:hypothetical protein
MRQQLDKVVESLEEQGCRIRHTRAGVFVYCPDGKTTIGFHLSHHSDRRAIKNIRSEVLRVGLTWPEGMS